MKEACCIATFCFGERYYSQANRLIKSVKENALGEVPVFVVTDSPDKILEETFVFVKHISEYDPSLENYATNYYDFNFSVKRYALRFCLESGYSKIALVDADVILTASFTMDSFINIFHDNCICGPQSYRILEETSSNLGSRLLHYNDKFGANIPMQKINDCSLIEDCIQFFSIEESKFHEFLSTWDSCIVEKYSSELINVPAGNIDEICFSAMFNNINTKMIPCDFCAAIHDKWY